MARSKLSRPQAKRLKMSNIGHSSRLERRIIWGCRSKNSPRNRYYPCFVPLAVQQPGKSVNCIRVLHAPNRTEIGSFPQPKLWRQKQENNRRLDAQSDMDSMRNAGAKVSGTPAGRENPPAHGASSVRIMGGIMAWKFSLFATKFFGMMVAREGVEPPTPAFSEPWF